MAVTPIKLIIIGSFGSGKTTLIRTISDTPTVETEVRLEEAVGEKVTTTVGIDFGTVRISEQFELLLFGVPGQQRYEAVWRSTLRGARAAILLTDARNEDWPDEALEFAQLVVRFAGNVPLVVGVNHCVDPRLEIPQNILALAPTVHLDARDRYSVKNLLQVLINHAQRRPSSPPAHDGS